MIGQSISHHPWQPRSLLRGLLFAFTALLGIEMGAGAFATSVIFPLWTASPTAAIGWMPNIPYYVEEGVFFMIASPVLFLLCVATLIAGWRAVPPLRLWLRIATVVYILIFITTLAYFVPVQEMVKGEAGATIPVAELRSMLGQFVTFNYIRWGASLLALGAALHALGLSYTMAGRREVEVFPRGVI